MKITTILLHYYSQRTQNIARIIKDLKASSRPPDKLIIFNNNPEVTYPTGKGFTVINSDKNYGGRGRYPIALLEPSDYYLFLDDDVSVCKNTIKNFSKYAYDGCCNGYWGKIVNPKARQCYVTGREIYGKSISEPKEVDLLVGEALLFVSFSAFKNIFKTEEMLLKENYIFGREEDLITSMSNRPFVIPAKADEYYTRLDTKGVGYCKTPGHFPLRNLMAKKLSPIRRQADSIPIPDKLKIKTENKTKENSYKPI